MNPQRHFCTYFDSNYLPTGLSLYESLLRHTDNCTLWVLCMDAVAYEFLESLDFQRLQPIALYDFEKGDTRLQAVKSNRSQVEYYFTCTPSLIRYILRENPSIPRITYLDADLMFYSSIDELFEDIGGASIAIHPHRFPTNQQDRANNVGRFNVGFVSIANDDTGRGCVGRWRNQCIDWCYDRVEDDKFADQKYLDEWPDRYDSVHIIEQKGAGLGWWNVEQYDLSPQSETLFVDEDKLIFYHFSELDRITDWLWDLGFNPSASVKNHIYRPYIQVRRSIKAFIEAKIGEELTSGSTRQTLQQNNSRSLRELFPLGYQSLKLIKNVLIGNTLVVRENTSTCLTENNPYIETESKQ